MSLLPLHLFGVGDIYLPADLDHVAHVLPFVVSSRILNFILLSEGHGPNIVLVSSPWEEEETQSPCVCERCIENAFHMDLAPVGSHKGIELHFDHWRFSDHSRS